VVDGHDYEKVSQVISEAVFKAKHASTPSLLIIKVPRLGPHTISDDSRKYRDEQMEVLEAKRDPLQHLERWLLEKKYITENELLFLKEEIKSEVKKAAEEADKLPFPTKESATTKLFKEFEIKDRNDVPPDAGEIVLMDGLNHALHEEMERDPGVIVFGQDVAGNKGGVFRITAGLTEKFGKDRCFNTPLAESTIIALATGLSFYGKHRPVAEIQFADYCWTGMNQLVNELATIYYRSNGMWNCPVVIRLPYGGYIQGGPYHSQSIETVFTHFPGLKVAVPSNAADAKRLLKMAIRDPNPVIFFEHKALYRQKIFSSRKEPSKDSLLSFGKANIVKEGKDITLIAWGMMVMSSFEVAKELDKEGISVELIDLRTLVPLDFETILTSLKKTAKVLIVQEAAKSTGFGAELSAKIVEEAFIHLDAPVMRVAAKDFPIPYAKPLEEAILPQKEDIKSKIIELARY
jgi:2-oxoisovalerate dehydrogenase E1 component